MSLEADAELTERLTVRETLAEVATMHEPELSPLTPRAQVLELTPAQVREVSVAAPPTRVQPTQMAVEAVAVREVQPVEVERPVVEPRAAAPAGAGGGVGTDADASGGAGRGA